MSPPIPRLDARAAVLLSLAVAGVLLAGAAVAGGAHYDESDYEAAEASNVTVHTYGGDDASQRRPGASGRSYWTESVIYGVPENETVYLTESVTYRPLPADCGPGDVDVLGIDRDATYRGERRVDEDVTDSIQSYSEDEDARDRYEREAGDHGDLTTAEGWTYVERIEVEWYGPDEIGSSVAIERGDRFVSAQRECFQNPDAAGWYRWAFFNEGELENGTTVSQDVPTFSHWYWVCDCEDRAEAIETLGPPPPEQGDATPTGTGGNGAGDEGVGDDGGEGGDGAGGSGDASGADGGTTSGTTTDAGTAGGDATADRTADGSGSAGSGDDGDATPDWDRIRVRTPSSGDGAGFTVGVAVVGALWALLGAHMLERRRR